MPWEASVRLWRLRIIRLNRLVKIPRCNRTGEGINDYPRVLRDTLMLLTVEGLKSGLREESLGVTGLETVLVERLVKHFQEDIIDKDGVRLRRPSGKQLRYMLWINSRVQNCSVHYEHVKTSAGAAERIAQHMPE